MESVHKELWGRGAHPTGVQGRNRKKWGHPNSVSSGLRFAQLSMKEGPNFTLRSGAIKT